MNNEIFNTYFYDRQHRINQLLTAHLPDSSTVPGHLHEAMRYAVLNGGKRIRPLLVYATGETLGLDLAILDKAASAVEFIHAYSLIHDDLPAMDNDDLRRGIPTCHKAFDEATAILAGDALQALAFSLLANQQQLTAEIRIAMVSCLAQATGSLGMVGGQALDIKATGQHVNKTSLTTIHQLKTGALILACIQLAILAHPLADNKTKRALLDFGHSIGLCFQIQDDILDAQGTTQVLGKQAGKDAAKQKATYATLNSIKEAKNSLEANYQYALKSLSSLGNHALPLKNLATYIVVREY